MAVPVKNSQENNILEVGWVNERANCGKRSRREIWNSARCTPSGDVAKTNVEPSYWLGDFNYPFKSIGRERAARNERLWNGRSWRILLQKSFRGGERKFLEPLMRLARGDVRDHIASSKIDHGPP
jgi:hypothetical protein